MKKLFVIITFKIFFIYFAFFNVTYSQNSSETPTKETNPKVQYAPSAEVEFGGGFSASDFDLTFGLRTVQAMAFNKHLNLGLGTGFYFSENSTKNEKFYEINIPLFVNFKYTILKTKWSPYLSVDAGCVFLNYINKNSKIHKVDGLLGGSIGAQYKFHNKASLYFGLGYEGFQNQATLRIGFQF